MDPSRIFAPVFMFGIIIIGSFLAGTTVGAYRMVHHREVIQHGAAHYDPVTAKFTWNTSATISIIQLEKQQ